MSRTDCSLIRFESPRIASPTSHRQTLNLDSLRGQVRSASPLSPGRRRNAYLKRSTKSTNIFCCVTSGTVELCEWVLYHPDTTGDGIVDLADADVAETYLPCGPLTLGAIDTDADGQISLAEWSAYQASIGHAQLFDKEWIFNIADLVVTAQGITNSGTRLMQIRFYPMNFTEFSDEFTPVD